MENLSEIDKKVYEYIKARDFVSKKWSSAQAAKDLNLSENDIYIALSNLCKYAKDKFQIDYYDGGLRIIAE